MTTVASWLLYLESVPVATAIRTNAGKAPRTIIATEPKTAYCE
jgi:hypothetical protein